MLHIARGPRSFSSRSTTSHIYTTDSICDIQKGDRWLCRGSATTIFVCGHRLWVHVTRSVDDVLAGIISSSGSDAAIPLRLPAPTPILAPSTPPATSAISITSPATGRMTPLCALALSSTASDPRHQFRRFYALRQTLSLVSLSINLFTQGLCGCERVNVRPELDNLAQQIGGLAFPVADRARVIRVPWGVLRRRSR